MPAGDWAQAGRISSQRFNNAMTAVAVNSVDPNKLIQASMASRSAQRKTAMKAKEALYTTENKIEAAEAKQDAEKSIAQSEMNVRKAGMLAAGALTITASQIKPPTRPMPDLRQDLGPMEEVIKNMEARHNRQVADMERELSEAEARKNAIGQMPTRPGELPGKTQQPAQPGETVGKTNYSIQPSQKPVSSLGDQSNAGNASNIVASMGFTNKEFNTFKDQVARIESGGRYDIPGGSNNHYDGKYQLGAAAKTDAARQLGIADPGHSPSARQAFRSNPQLQEQMFEGFTKANHNFLMSNPTYANASNPRKLEILGYAHNQGMGGASNYLKTGQVGYDGFGTAGTKYISAVRSGFENQ